MIIKYENKGYDFEISKPDNNLLERMPSYLGFFEIYHKSILKVKVTRGGQGGSVKVSRFRLLYGVTANRRIL